MSAKNRFSSWKEIAEYLDCDVKTAQRYEKLRDLPVHRVPGGQRSTVFAYRDEIEEWLKREKLPPLTGATEVQRPPTSRRGIVLAGAAAILLAGAGVFSLTRRRRPIGKVELSDHDLIGRDRGGRELWRHTLQDRPSLEPGGRLLRTVDWRGAGDPDAVAAVGYRSPAVERSELLCYSPSGELRWKWTPTTKLLDFNGQPFEDVWYIQDMATARFGGRETLWVSIVNKIRWASAIYRIDPDGSAHLHFANHGYIILLAAVDDNKDPRLIATGINNAVDRPFAAVIGLTDPPSVAPPLGSPRYRYANSPPGSPRRYILLPNSEFNIAKGEPYPIPKQLDVSPNLVKVEPWDPLTNSPLYIYEFDTHLRPLKARASAGTITQHRNQHRTGILDHPPETCRELLEPHVLRSWTSSAGWEDVQLPLASQLNMH